MSPTLKTTTTNDRPLHPAANDAAATSDTQPITAETKIHGALQNNPGATTTELAKAAGVGRSTAAKILARRAAEGVLIRTEGKDQQTPDTWAIPDSTNGAGGKIDDTQPESGTHNVPTAHDIFEANDDGASAASGPSDIAGTSGGDDALADDVQPSEVGPGPDDITVPESTTAAEFAPVVTVVPDDSTNELHAPSYDATTGDTAPDPGVPGDEPRVEGSRHDGPVVVTTEVQKDRLPKGGLYDLVKAYLAKHPGDSFGPAKISADLGRSGGAISNALDKLVTDGHATKTCEAPKRFIFKAGSE